MFQEMGLLSELTSLVMVMKDSSLQARILLEPSSASDKLAGSNNVFIITKM